MVPSMYATSVLLLVTAVVVWGEINPAGEESSESPLVPNDSEWLNTLDGRGGFEDNNALNVGLNVIHLTGVLEDKSSPQADDVNNDGSSDDDEHGNNAGNTGSNRDYLYVALVCLYFMLLWIP